MSDMVHRIKQVERMGMEARGDRPIASGFERDDGYPHVEVAPRLDGNELWEIMFGILEGDVPDELTDEVFQKTADAINTIFKDTPRA